MFVQYVWSSFWSLPCKAELVFSEMLEQGIEPNRKGFGSMAEETVVKGSLDEDWSNCKGPPVHVQFRLIYKQPTIHLYRDYRDPRVPVFVEFNLWSPERFWHTDDAWTLLLFCYCHNLPLFLRKDDWSSGQRGQPVCCRGLVQATGSAGKSLCICSRNSREDCSSSWLHIIPSPYISHFHSLPFTSIHFHLCRTWSSSFFWLCRRSAGLCGAEVGLLKRSLLINCSPYKSHQKRGKSALGSLGQT